MTDLNADPASLIPTNTRLRRSRSIWRVLAFIALAVAIVALVGRFAITGSATTDRIARIDISGTITTDRARAEVIAALAEDDSIKAVLVTINSPGGTTAGGEELYEDLTALRQKKPVVVTINELGASAAYMTAIAADRVFARRLSIVGSIGVLYQHVNAGKLLDTIGIDLDKVASGPLKAEPDFDEAISPEVRASLTALIMDSFNWFVDIVAERRNLDRQAVLTLADGRIVTGRQGLENGLIDELGGEAEALAWLGTARDIKADLPVVTAWPLPDNAWGGLGRWLGGEARSALGMASGPIVLDGLVSLWQADSR